MYCSKAMSSRSSSKCPSATTMPVSSFKDLDLPNIPQGKQRCQSIRLRFFGGKWWVKVWKKQPRGVWRAIKTMFLEKTEWEQGKLWDMLFLLILSRETWWIKRKASGTEQCHCLPLQQVLCSFVIPWHFPQASKWHSIKPETMPLSEQWWHECSWLVRVQEDSPKRS